MNKITKILTLIFGLTGIIFLNSCVKEKFDAPEITAPTVDFSSNSNIAVLNQLSDSFSAIPVSDTTVPFGIITKDIIIEGTVVGNDESGNIYKNLYIQDASGAIDIALDAPGLYTNYRIGQKILVKCKGLYIGNYGGAPELGYIYNKTIGRIPAAFINDHLFLDGFPGAAPVPSLMTIPGFTSANRNSLVKLDSVYFMGSDVGQVFGVSTATATNRTILDKNGNTLVIRTSNYANFAGKLVPSGYGSVTGILSIFNGTWQLIVRDTNDLVGFGGVSPLFLSEPFTTTFGSFAPYSVTGAEVWAITSYGATITGYSGGTNHADEDWLISSSIDLTHYSSPMLSFSSTMNYGAAGDGSLTLWYSTDYVSGAPSTGTWTQLTGFALSAGGWATTPSGNIDLSAATGSNVHIALKYTSTASSSATWEITNVLGKGTPN
jgi:hypothetical protein